MEIVGGSTLMRGRATGGSSPVRGIAQREIGNAGEADDLAGDGFVDFLELHAFGEQDLGDAHLLGLAEFVQMGNGLVDLEVALAQAAHGQPAHELLEVQAGDLQQRIDRSPDSGRRNPVDDHFEQGHEVGIRIGHLPAAGALAAGSEDVAEVELFMGSAQFAEQIEYLVQGLVGLRAGAIDLVDDHGQGESHLQRLLGHEAGLGHGAFEGVHDEQSAVHGSQDAFHLPAEIGVPGGVHDVDQVILILDRCISSRGW